MEVGGSGLVARRTDLHRRSLQERREDDLRQRGGAEGSVASLQLQSRGEHKACHRFPRGRQDRRGGAEGSRSRRRDAEQEQSPKLSRGFYAALTALSGTATGKVRLRI